MVADCRRKGMTDIVERLEAAWASGEGCDLSETLAAKQEIQSLRQQLADAHEREANARCTHCGGVFFETDLSKQLALSQAREKVLRDGLRAMQTKVPSALNEMVNMILCNVPSNSTALDEAIKQAKREALLAAASVAEEYEDKNVFGSAVWIRRMAEELK